MQDYPVCLVESTEPVSLAELPDDELRSRDLYNAFTGPANGEEAWLAIGTPDELRGLVADGILPSNVWFTLEARAA